MHRAHSFIKEAREEALNLMGKGIKNLHLKELDTIIALCNLHEEVCEFVEIEEKFDIKPHTHDATGRRI